jgi:hypothetical protein
MNYLGPQEKFVFRFIDDRPDIINSLTDFFARHSDLVPKQCFLEASYMSSNYDHYPEEHPDCKPKVIVQGTGELQCDYRWVCMEVANEVNRAVEAHKNAQVAIKKALLAVTEEFLHYQENLEVEMTPTSKITAEPKSKSPDSIAAVFSEPVTIGRGLRLKYS